MRTRNRQTAISRSTTRRTSEYCDEGSWSPGRSTPSGSTRSTTTSRTPTASSAVPYLLVFKTKKKTEVCEPESRGRYRQFGAARVCFRGSYFFSFFLFLLGLLGCGGLSAFFLSSFCRKLPRSPRRNFGLGRIDACRCPQALLPSCGLRNRKPFSTTNLTVSRRSVIQFAGITVRTAQGRKPVACRIEPLVFCRR